MFNVPESNKDDSMERVHENTEICSEVLKERLKVEEVEIEQVYHLGRRQEGKMRPLTVKLTRGRGTWEALKKAKQLKKESEDWIKQVGIAPDLTKREREEQNKKLKGEFQEKRRQGDNERNEKIMKILEEGMESLQNKQRVILLGDFNGHLGYLGPQKINKNGRNVIHFIEKWNMSLLNGDLNCEGEITRRQENTESTINFVLVNQVLHKSFEYMSIDENKEKYELSGHCLLEVNFNIDTVDPKRKDEFTKVEYYETNCDNLKAQYLKNMREDTEDLNRRGVPVKMEEYENLMRKNVDKILKKENIRKVKKYDNGYKVEDPPWITGEIRQGLKLRKHYNREKRKAREDREKEKYEYLYQSRRKKSNN
ncbi:hypothetical protein SK128_009160 [Halocaridina rubra]|uniref:Endonuclease/exonuclease/phosphatase domain-containing protein n=1 Tax=Halocaridina rubra TaxID=373956 RepID=A0AAN8ZRT1_HALRR